MCPHREDVRTPRLPGARLTVFLALLLLPGAADAQVRAPAPLLQADHPVDWWFVFKLNSEVFQFCGENRDCRFGGEVQRYKYFGLQYAFASSEEPKLEHGPGCAGNGLSDPVGATFDEVYNGKYHYVIWNDQFYDDPPINGCAVACSSPWGHSKGLVAWDDNGDGFAMQVSTPSWPASGSAAFPRRTDGNTLGCIKDNDVLASQHFFALKLTHSDLVAVLGALSNASVVTDPRNPQIVNNGGPADVQALVSQLGSRSSSTAATRTRLSSGVGLISKPSGLHVPPWQLVSAVLGGVGLRTATWWTMPKIPTTGDSTPVGCWDPSLGKPGRVEIASKGIWSGKEFGLAGKVGKDSNHAKVGVSLAPDKPYAIFGDLNQQGALSGNCGSSGNGRGGLFWVVENADLAASVKDLISGGGASPAQRPAETEEAPAPQAFGWWESAWSRVKSSPLVSGGVLLSLLALALAPSRLVSQLLAQDVLVINKLAPWFYLTGFGRRRLFGRYRAEIAGSPDVREDSARYVDLPYDCDAWDPAKPLTAAIKESLRGGGAIEVNAEGGRGKTSLCRYLAVDLIRDASTGRRLEPVLVDGLDYNGSLAELIAGVLKRSRAYVNPAIVESQLEAGRLAVLFDGVSEIREAFRGAAESDISVFIRKHPDTPFLFTSRSALPAPLAQALKNRASVKLKDLDSATLAGFLSHYLKNQAAEVEQVIAQIETCLGGISKIPLMLKLVAAVYDRTGRVPTDRSTLLSQYSDHLLRPEATGVTDAAGLQFGLRHLVRETHLKSGGDRGFSVEDGVRLIGAIRGDLANYDIKGSPIELVGLFGRAGLLKRSMDYCRFFHDSFESYFAARALAVDFHNRQYALLVACRSNPRLTESWEFFVNMLDAEEVSQLAKALEGDAGGAAPAGAG